MNQQYDNTNSGALFKNENQYNENSPNARGPSDIKCPCCGETTKFWISSWTKISKAGKRFQSLAFTPDDPSKSKPNTNNGIGPAQPSDFDEDIPF